MPPQNERNIIFLSELGHIDMLGDFLGRHTHIRKEGFMLIPLDLEIEYALKEKGIPFRSGGAYRTPDAAVMTLAEDWTASVLESERWSFFTYRGVALSRLYFMPLQNYLSYVIYYADIVSNVLTTHTQTACLIIFSPLDNAPAIGNTLVGPRMRVIVDVVECFAAQSGKEVIVVPTPALPVGQWQPAVPFMFKRALFGIGIGILNTFVMLLRRPRRLRALASDYWKNLVPYVSYLDSLEIVLIDRMQAFKVGFSNIWKFRMRFLHLDAFSSNVSSENIKARNRIAREFESLKRDTELLVCEFRGFSLRPIFSRALDIIVKEVLTDTLKEIDDAHDMFEQVRPHIVLLRATMSGQTHFVILAQVARARGVPSLEVQHGLEYYGPGSYTRRHSSQYMGVYGPLTQKEMKAVGDVHSTPVVIGSPRFDVYASILKRNSTEPSKSQDEKISFLCFAPAVEPGCDLDTYDYEEFFSAIASALKKIPNATAVIKFRGPNRDSFTRRTIASLFADIPYTIAQTEPLSELFPHADVVISCFSTAAIEAMQCGKPLVYLGLSPAQSLMGLHHFSAYAEQDAIRLATNKEDLVRIVEELAQHDARTGLAAQGVAFLEREYAFDGHASERTAQLVLSLTAEKK